MFNTKKGSDMGDVHHNEPITTVDELTGCRVVGGVVG